MRMAVCLLVTGFVGSVLAEDPAWDRSISAGVNLTDGNSETMTLTAGLLVERKRDEDHARIALDGQYGEVSGAKTNEQALLSTAYSRDFSERAYLVGDLKASYDAIADIDYRVIVSPGLGYYVTKSDASSLGLELGPSWVVEKVGGVTDDYAALRIGQRYERTLSETAKVWQSSEYLPNVEDAEADYLLNAEIGAEAQMNDRLSIRLVARTAYDNTPAQDRERNDLTVTGALVYTL